MARMNRLGINCWLCGVGLLAVGGTAHATLFLSDWGVLYGAWAPVNRAPGIQAAYVVEDYTGGGNGYLGPGYGGDAYDVEAAYLGVDDQYFYLAVVTGFPSGGRYDPGTGDFYLPGDLAIDVGSDGSYDFAVDVDHGGALRSHSLVWENPTIQGHHAWGGASDPFRAVSWGQTDATAAFGYGSFAGRYAIEAMVDRSLLPVATSYTLHWTMGCGNDVLNVPLRPVPEPSSLILLGGALGLAWAACRLRK
jgi:hypothetical protein